MIPQQGWEDREDAPAVTTPALQPALFLADVHVPYEDKRAWALMLHVARVLKPYHLVVNGDLADFMTVSSHSKDPRRSLQLADEVAAVNVALDQLDALGATEKKFIAGNHCSRLTRYLEDRAPQLFDLVGIPELFRLPARGWAYTPYKSHTKLGKLYITHDVGVAGRFAAYRALDTYQHSVTTGHSHRLCYIVEGNAVGEHKLSASFGWLGDRSQIDYMTQANVNKNWALGFGIGYIEPVSGVAYLTPVPIIEVAGKLTCVVGGQFYSG